MGASQTYHSRRVARFGVFEFDLTHLKLSRNGRDTGLQQQPATLLAYMVDRAGMVVTRAELKDAIWQSGTYVEFDFGLNTAINRLRRALRDSAAEPRYIETVPKQGYRFIAPVELVLPIPLPGPELVEAAPSGVRKTMEAAGPTAFPARPDQRKKRRRRLGIAAASLALLAGGVIALRGPNRQAVESAAVVRSYLALPPGHVPEVVVVSPKGDEVVYQAVANGVRGLYRRSLEEEDSRPIPGSEGGTQPFYSPDGTGIGFFAPGCIRVEQPDGTRDVVHIPEEFDLRRAIWGEDQSIYYTTPEQGIWKVAARGGTAPRQVLKPEASASASPFYFPQQVLGGDPPTLLCSANSGPKRRWISRLAADGGSRPEKVVERAMGGQLMSNSHLLYYWQGKLFAAPFDRRSMKLAGSGVEVATNVAPNGWRGPNAGVSESGTLVYLEQERPVNRLVWVDAQGRETPLASPEANYEQAEVSPDGSRIAIVRRDGPELWTVWIHDLRSGAWDRLLEQDTPYPRMAWSPDGKSAVVSAAFREAEFVNLYRLPVGREGGSPERLLEAPNEGEFPNAWSGAANAILFTAGVHVGTQSDVYTLPLEGPRQPRPLVASKGVDRAPAFSTDGHWFAYASDAGGKSQVFVQRFDQSSPAQQISKAGGSNPLWAPDGGGLYFLDPRHALMEVPCRGGGCGGALRQVQGPGFAEPGDWWTRAYSIAPNGRFLVIREAQRERAPEPRIRVVVNWLQEVRRLVPPSRGGQ